MKRGMVLMLGACSDIATALARVYAENGYDLQLAARRSERLVREAENLRIRYGAQVSIHEFDIRAFDGHAAFYKGLPSPPDGIICVAGYLGDQKRAETDPDEARSIIETNYLGPVSILNLVAADFERRGQGFMVGIGSVAGDRGRQSNYLYGSAKAGFAAYLSGLRNRLSSIGITVLTVKPGFVDTAMTKDLSLPPALTSSPERVARDIYRAQQRGRNVLYTAWYWMFIMLVIRSIPEMVFKRLKL